MAFAESYGRPPASAAKLNRAIRRGPSLSLTYQEIVGAAVWIFVACGSIALIEPSPYDFASFLAIPIWAFGGFSLHRSFLFLFFLLVLQAIAGFFALLPYLNDTDAVLYQCQTAYLTVTGLFFAAYVGERTQERAELILKGYTVGALIAAVCGIAGYFDLGGLGETFSLYGRASGTFKDPNVLGSFVILAALYLIQNALLARVRSILLTLAGLTVIVAAIFLSFSRGSWGAFVFAVIFMMSAAFFTAENAKTQRRIAAFAITGTVFVGIVILALLSFDETREIFLQRAALTQEYDAGETGRFGNQFRSFPMLLERFAGFGPLRFRLVFGLEPHNSYIGAFANDGWIGGLLFILIVGITVWIGARLMFKRWPYQRLAQVYFSSLMAFYLQAFQIDIDHWRHVYLMLGGIWGLEAARQKWQARERAPQRATMHREALTHRGAKAPSLA